jgi:hypothetical protein
MDRANAERTIFAWRARGYALMISRLEKKDWPVGLFPQGGEETKRLLRFYRTLR